MLVLFLCPVGVVRLRPSRLCPSTLWAVLQTALQSVS